jgi:hypothetical protein
VIKPALLEVHLAGQDVIHCELPITASALGQVAYYQSLTELGPSLDITPLYLREPDAVPAKPKKVSG